MECSICHGPVEPWPGTKDDGEPFGYGNNPMPVASLDVEDRCCRWCNEHVVIPIRLRQVGGWTRKEA